eukprot:361260-Chlamydomonas_euryale.AAC.6
MNGQTVAVIAVAHVLDPSLRVCSTERRLQLSAIDRCAAEMRRVVVAVRLLVFVAGPFTRHAST